MEWNGIVLCCVVGSVFDLHKWYRPYWRFVSDNNISRFRCCFKLFFFPEYHAHAKRPKFATWVYTEEREHNTFASNTTHTGQAHTIIWRAASFYTKSLSEGLFRVNFWPLIFCDFFFHSFSARFGGGFNFWHGFWCRFSFIQFLRFIFAVVSVVFRYLVDSLFILFYSYLDIFGFHTFRISVNIFRYCVYICYARSFLFSFSLFIILTNQHCNVSRSRSLSKHSFYINKIFSPSKKCVRFQFHREIEHSK